MDRTIRAILEYPGHPEGETGMATAGTIVFEIKIAVDIVLAEDGKYCVDASTTKGDAVHSWTEGPFDSERKARESLQWQFAVPVIEKL
jgi:hypothetical protein